MAAAPIFARNVKNNTSILQRVRNDLQKFKFYCIIIKLHVEK